jgi:molybdenum cofactor biosynthesis enzyme MoaA
MKKLRLLVTSECNRSCSGCCNKEWDLDKLPVCESYKDYDEIYLTEYI